VGHGKARLEPVLYLLGYKPIHTRVGERHHGTNRLRNQRQVRTTVACSQARRSHGWMSGRSVGLYNCCRPHRSLKITQADQVAQRSPALAAGVTAHLWATRAWVLRPVLGGQRSSQDITYNKVRNVGCSKYVGRFPDDTP
jgi:hypothetical protein